MQARTLPLFNDQFGAEWVHRMLRPAPRQIDPSPWAAIDLNRERLPPQELDAIVRECGLTHVVTRAMQAEPPLPLRTEVRRGRAAISSYNRRRSFGESRPSLPLRSLGLAATLRPDPHAPPRSTEEAGAAPGATAGMGARRGGARRGRSRRWREVLTSPEAVAIAAVLAVFVVLRPFGDYAVDDEWAFLKSLQHLHETGQVRILSWNPMSLVGFLHWGALFAQPAGFSFTAARVSALVAYALLGFSVAAALRELGVGRRVATMAVLTVVLDPLCLFHGVLYQTDVAACAVGTLALLFMIKGLGDDAGRRRWLLVLGSAAGSFAILIRQGMIVVPLALLAHLMIFRRRRLASLDGALAAIVLPGLTTLLFAWWYWGVHGPTSMYVLQSRRIAASLLHPAVGDVLRALFDHSMYVGFFLLPLAAAGAWWRGAAGADTAAAGARRTGLLVALSVAGLFGAGVAIRRLVDGLVFPYLPNKISPFGFLAPNELIVGDRPVLWGAPVAWIVTIACVLSLAAFAFAAASSAFTLRRSPERNATAPPAGLHLAALLGLGQFLYLIATRQIVFDRHLLVQLPTAVILLAAWGRRERGCRIGCAVVLIPLAWAGIAGAHDVHAISRAAFKAGNDLLSAGVPVHDIDAGYAFDGWWTFEQSRRDRIVRGKSSDPWWIAEGIVPGVGSRYVVSLSETLSPGVPEGAWRPWNPRAPDLGPRRTVRTYDYTTWWPYGERTLFVLERLAE